MENPTRGVTAEDYLSGAVPPPAQAPRIIASDYVMPYSWQSSIGFQKQLGAAMGFDADLTYLDERDQVRGRDPNLFYDPVTGYNLDPARFGRPNPTYGQMQWMESTGRTEALLLSSLVHPPVHATTSRAGVTYTRTLRRNDDTTGFGIQANNQFDLDGDWSRSSDFQRDTFRANGIVNLPWQMTRGRLVSLRLGHLLQRHALGPAVRQAGHQPPEHRRADHDPGGGARSLGRPGRHRHQHGVAAQRPARAAAAQGGHAALEPHRQGRTASA